MTDRMRALLYGATGAVAALATNGGVTGALAAGIGCWAVATAVARYRRV